MTIWGKDLQKRNSEGILQGYDLIWNGIEITTGAQREHRYEEIVKNAKEKGLDNDVKFYLEFFLSDLKVEILRFLFCKPIRVGF